MRSEEIYFSFTSRVPRGMFTHSCIKLLNILRWFIYFISGFHQELLGRYAKFHLPKVTQSLSGRVNTSIKSVSILNYHTTSRKLILGLLVKMEM